MMSPKDRVRTLLRERLPKDWDAPLGRIEVEQIRPTRQSGLWVALRDTGFPVDPDGYYFVNPPLAVRGLEIVKRRPIEAFRAIVTDAAEHYANRPAVHGLTTTTIFGSTEDGRVLSQSAASYAIMLAGNSMGASTTETFAALGQNYNGTTYLARQHGYAWDTSSIPDTDTIDSVELSLASSADLSTTDFTFEVYDYDFDTTLTTADWRTPAQLSALAILASRSTVGWSAAGYNVFTSEAGFPAHINKTGTTRVWAASNRNRLETTPANGVNEHVVTFFADEAGTTSDPKLVINHAADVGVAARKLRVVASPNRW